MSVNLSIKGVPDDVAERLRERAARNHRSLQGELLAIVEAAARTSSPGTGTGEQPMSAGRRTLEQIMADRQARGWQPSGGDSLPLAVDIIRADRDSR